MIVYKYSACGTKLMKYVAGDPNSVAGICIYNDGLPNFEAYQVFQDEPGKYLKFYNLQEWIQILSAEDLDYFIWNLDYFNKMKHQYP